MNYLKYSVVLLISIFIYACPPPDTKSADGNVEKKQSEEKVQAQGLTAADLVGLVEYETRSPDGNYRIGDLGKVVVSDSSTKRQLTIVKDIARIPDKAFRNKKLTSVSIPNAVKSLGLAVFVGNTDLATVTLPKELFDKLSEKELEEKFGTHVTSYQDLAGNSLTK